MNFFAPQTENRCSFYGQMGKLEPTEKLRVTCWIGGIEIMAGTI